MKNIHAIFLILIFFMGCQSTDLKKETTGLKKITREEAATKYAGKKDIIEYYRNSQ